MSLLLPPKEKVLARRFCEMIHRVGLVKDERIVHLSVERYLDKLCNDGKNNTGNGYRKSVETV